MDQSAYTRKIRDSTRARGPRGPQASPYRDAAGSFMVSVAGGASYVGCTNCDANAPVVPSVLGVFPVMAPDAPTIGIAMRGNAQATVSFTAPLNNGGSPITSYRATSSPGGFTADATTSPITVTGLTNGTSYTFRVTATNSTGTSTASAASNTVKPTSSWLEYDPSDPDSYVGSGTVIRSVGTYGNVSDGTLQSGVTFDTSRNGVLDFPGGDGSIILFPSITMPSSMTVCAWVYPRQKNTINGLFTNAASGWGVNGFKFQWNFYESGTRVISFQNGNGTAGDEDRTAEYIINYGAWQHISYVFDQVNRIILFFYNGEPVAVASTIAGMPVADINLTAPFSIGGYTNGLFTMNAKLGSIKVFNSLLNASQIRNDYNATKTRFDVITTVPVAPSIVSTTAGNRQATVSFTAPLNNGGSPITSYTVTATPGGASASGTSSPIVVSGLTNGTSYIFTTTATNSVGTSAASTASAAVTPATVPDAPIIGTATRGNGQATVTFTAPLNNGGSPITSYRATSSPGGFTGTVTAPGSSITVTGLTNGISYTFTVIAVNNVGESTASAVSNSVIPILSSLRTVTFNSSGTWTAPDDVTDVSYIVVGGGGGSGGGYNLAGGGGGGGGMVRLGTIGVTSGSYPITVGAGGTAGISIRGPPASETSGGNGGNSVFNGVIALGGGGGYASRLTESGTLSLGGRAAILPNTASTGGSGGGPTGAGGGGGGSSDQGQSGVPGTGGNGGAGTSSSITGSTVIYGVGGAGAKGTSPDSPEPGTANTGNGANGGGPPGGGQTNGAIGGSGIVVLQYMSAYAP